MLVGNGCLSWLVCFSGLVMDVDGSVLVVDVVSYCLYCLCLLLVGDLLVLVLVGLVVDVVLLKMDGCWLLVL